MHLSILPEDSEIQSMYQDHSTYHEGDSGLDLFFPEDVNMEPHETKIISLGIKCEAYPSRNKEHNISYYLYPRSSISKTPLRMANSVGIIDSGYRGPIMIALDNTQDTTYRIEADQRLFQICSPTLAPDSFELTNCLSDTTRAEGGFGSTD